MTTDEQRIYNERAERLAGYRTRITELEQQLYTAEQKYTGACIKLAEVEKTMAESREDKARLDWLERQISFEGLHVWPRWEPTSANPECKWAWFTAALEAGPFETMREAIDAARNKVQ